MTLLERFTITLESRGFTVSPQKDNRSEITMNGYPRGTLYQYDGSGGNDYLVWDDFDEYSSGEYEPYWVYYFNEWKEAMTFDERNDGTLYITS